MVITESLRCIGGTIVADEKHDYVFRALNDKGEPVSIEESDVAPGGPEQLKVYFGSTAADVMLKVRKGACMA